MILSPNRIAPFQIDHPPAVPSPTIGIERQQNHNSHALAEAAGTSRTRTNRRRNSHLASAAAAYGSSRTRKSGCTHPSALSPRSWHHNGDTSEQKSEWPANPMVRPVTHLHMTSPPPQIVALCSGAHTLRRVFLFAPSAPAVQIFIPTMRAFDRGQLIIEIRQRFAARCCGRNRDD